MTTPTFEPLPTPAHLDASPLIARLSRDFGYPQVDAASLESFLAAVEGLAVVFVTGDPRKLLDTGDVAVILPELVAHFAGRLTPAVLARDAEALAATRLGAEVKPALVFLAAGRPVGVIPRVRDWDEYTSRIEGYLAQTLAATDIPGRAN